MHPTEDKNHSNIQDISQDSPLSPKTSPSLITEATPEILIPISESITMNTHSNLITCFSLDSCKNRLVVGSSDYQVSYWDLPNLNSSLKPFRVLEPHEKQVITAVSFNYDDSKVLVCGGGSKPKILTRDGREEIEFMKGDMYIRDLLHTKGHTSSVTDGFFCPNAAEKCYTSSMDGSIRIWDLNARPFGIEQQLPSAVVVKCKSDNLQRAGVQKMVLSDKGALVAFCEDNSIQVFSENTKFHRPELILRSDQVSQATKALVLRDGVTLLSREMDDTVKTYDLRKFTEPVRVFKNLPNNFEHTGLCLSKDEKVVVTGTSVTKDEEGQLVVVYLEEDKPEKRIVLEGGSVTSFLWDHNLNQIFVGVGNDIRVFYDPISSKKGVVGANKRALKKHIIEDEMGQKAVYVPNALSMFRPDQNNKRKRFEKVRGDEKLTKKPTEMLTGPGYNGMISGPRTTAQYVMKTIHEIKGKQVDPLEVLKKYANQARDNPQFVDSAYLLTQPKKLLIYDYKDGDEQRLMSLFTKCKHCGMKICQCTNKKGTI